MAEVKPRFDGKMPNGFANMHRLLGNKELMFDVDRCYIDVLCQLSLKKENELFIEYNFIQSKVVFKAVFEVKYSKSRSALEALDKNNANSIARCEMAKKLDCRLFVVYQDNGKQPFDFYEINTNTGDSKLIGTLSYTNGNSKQAWRFFWDNILKL